MSITNGPATVEREEALSTDIHPRPDAEGHGSVLGPEAQRATPKPWDSFALDSTEVKDEQLDFVLRAVETMRPDFLAIGMENNILLSNDPAKCKQLELLHAATCDAVKARHPRLRVCFTTEVTHYRKLAREAHDKDQEGEVPT